MISVHGFVYCKEDRTASAAASGLSSFSTALLDQGELRLWVAAVLLDTSDQATLVIFLLLTPCHQCHSRIQPPQPLLFWACLWGKAIGGWWSLAMGILHSASFGTQSFWDLVFFLFCISFFIYFFGIKIMFFLPSHSTLDFLRATATSFISVSTVHSTFSSVKISVDYWLTDSFSGIIF